MRPPGLPLAGCRLLPRRADRGGPGAVVASGSRACVVDQPAPVLGPSGFPVALGGPVITASRGPAVIAKFHPIWAVSAE